MLGPKPRGAFEDGESAIDLLWTLGGHGSGEYQEQLVTPIANVRLLFL